VDLTGKRALVTGGSRGIGAAIALHFAQHGASVVINGRTEDESARAVAEQIQALGGQTRFIAADVADPAQVESLVQQSVATLGGLDILVHNAGGPAPGRIEEVTPQQWNAAFDLHVHAAYHLCRFGLPHLKKNSAGAIVLVSSSAGIRGCPGAVVYGTVKGAITQMTRMLARDLADDNIRVNCVAPGVIPTQFHVNMTDAQRSNNIENRIPLHREGTPTDVAEVVHLLATNEYMTGETVVVDGGLSMQITR